MRTKSVVFLSFATAGFVGLPSTASAQDPVACPPELLEQCKEIIKRDELRAQQEKLEAQRVAFEAERKALLEDAAAFNETVSDSDNRIDLDGLRQSQKQATEASQTEANKKKVGGVDFGVGLAFTYDLGDNDRIKEAELVNGIVRVTDRENVTGRFMLESHYFFTPDTGFLSLDAGQWGVGPFIAVEASSDPIIQAIGGGVMFGFRRLDENGFVGNDSFNLGIGVVYDLNQQVLGEGIIANMPLPEGETEVRFLETEQAGLMILSSYSF